MVKEPIPDQKYLLSFAKVFIGFPSWLKFLSTALPIIGGEVNVADECSFGSSSWSPYSDHFFSVLVFTILIIMPQMEGFRLRATQKGGPKNIFGTCQVHPLSVENIRIQPQVHFCIIHPLIHSFNN